MMIRRVGVPLVCFALLLAACGGGQSALEKTQSQLSESQRGEMNLELSAGGSEERAIGFRFAGLYSYEGDGPYAVVDLEYTRFAGAEETSTRVVSTGRQVFVQADGRVRELTANDAAALRLGDSDAGATDGLGIAGWVRNPKSTARGGSTVVTGSVNAADLLVDLANVMNGVVGASGIAEPGDDADERVNRLVRSSTIKVVSDRDDHSLRSLDAVIAFRADAGRRLTSALGEYSSGHLEVHLRHRRLPDQLVVTPPV